MTWLPQVALVLRIHNSVLRSRFEEQERKQWSMVPRQLFHGTHIDCAEAIAQEVPAEKNEVALIPKLQKIELLCWLPQHLRRGTAD